MAITDAPRLKATTVEPGGIEAIPASRRHGSPWQLIATWTAPNLEFATVFVGAIAIAFFGLGFWQAMLALALGNALGALSQGILSTWGPREGLAQLVLSRTAFGSRGNILPSALNTVMAGLGWFAVNSVSGALALSTLTGMPPVLALLIVVVVEVAVAFVGHDLVQVFERYASIILGIIFLIATITVLSHANIVGPHASSGFSFGGFTLTVAAAFGYAAGWNPYASDYSRYLPKATSPLKIGLGAGIGNFVSCTVLMAAGAAAATIAGFDAGNPTTSFVSSMPPVIRDLTLIAICIGAIAANALNIYSGAMSFLAAGIKIRFSLRRAIVALGFGVIGFFIAWSALADAGTKYEDFLLVIAYWIAPWLGIVLVDRYLRRGTSIAELVPDHAKYRNAAGVIAMVVAGVVSIWLFSDQVQFVGIIAHATTPPVQYANPAIGDLTPLVGFLLAGVLYYVLFKALKPALGGPLADEPELIIGVDAADEVA
ncbi:purine-cytosine permease family protein [Galbitalea soli]|uniref:Cytosine permease n=1 Tax=Galbitalea soli TaxID=1268042 RepID=A0A7C9TS47_9MICO|nr:cytosine permease [Galbitalea soli]NEM91880.1 cytosine permease [Galbitalea soli]NYJ29284.1 NCS1 family nucleobase:cation symporter-1 [Galbitalea soli]